MQDPQVIHLNNIRRGGGDGSPSRGSDAGTPRSPMRLTRTPPLTPRSSVDADDDDIETIPPHHPAPSQSDTRDALQDAPQLLPPPPLPPPPCLEPPPPLPDEVEATGNRLSTKDAEMAEIMKGPEPWQEMMSLQFIPQRSDNSRIRTNSSVDRAVAQGHYQKCRGRWAMKVPQI